MGVNGVINDIRLISSGSEISKRNQSYKPEVATSLSTIVLRELTYELVLILLTYWSLLAKLAQESY